MQNIETTSPHKKESQPNTRVGEQKTPFRNYFSLVFGAGLIIFLDQWTKALVLRHIPFLDSWIPAELFHLEPYIRIVHWRNSGAAFGLFQNGNVVFMVLAIIASIFIFAYYPLIEKSERYLKIAMIFQLGGAIGNLIDRIRFGYVIDFISIGEFPVFNVADAAISTGVVVLLISVLVQEYKEYQFRKSFRNQSLPSDSKHDLIQEKE